VYFSPVVAWLRLPHPAARGTLLYSQVLYCFIMCFTCTPSPPLPLAHVYPCPILR